MKRLIATSLVLALIMLPLALEGAGGESWNKITQTVVVGASQNVPYGPTVGGGTPVRAQKITISSLASAAVIGTFVTYTPLTAGPATATDSTVWTYMSGALIGATTVFYFPSGMLGDSLRVTTGAGGAHTILTFYAD